MLFLLNLVLCSLTDWQCRRETVCTAQPIKENPAVSITTGFLKIWSRVRESNPPSQLGKLE